MAVEKMSEPADLSPEQRVPTLSITTAPCIPLREKAIKMQVVVKTVALPDSARDLDRLETASEDDQVHTPFHSRFQTVCFCFAVGVSQLIAEYLISGFGPLSSYLHSTLGISSGWPTVILPIVLAAATIPLSRLADIYGGAPVFLAGMTWLFPWTLVAGFTSSEAALSLARAMQGLAIAAFQPAAFSLMGTLIPKGKRRNIVFGIYASQAPLGFFAGILSSTLVIHFDNWSWYFWTAAILSLLSVAAALYSIPPECFGFRNPNLSMDYFGSITSILGLILVVYSLSSLAHTEAGWNSPSIYLPLSFGIACLICLVYVEIRVSNTPLLPPHFFKYRSVTPLLVASIFFYGSFGIFLFYSTYYLQEARHLGPLTLLGWYTPLALGGILVSLVSSALMHRIPLTYLLLLSSIFWVLAPALFGVFIHLNPSTSWPSYFSLPFPSIIASTAGLDLTYTITTVFLTSTVPPHLQGMAGATASVTVNLGIAVSMVVADVLFEKAPVRPMEHAANIVRNSNRRLFPESYKPVFWLAFALAAAGMVICVLFVRMPRADGENEEHGEVVMEEVETQR